VSRCLIVHRILLQNFSVPGMVGINEGMISAAEAAFGGVKASYSLHVLSSWLSTLN
jgi:hypothetical protein